MIMKYEVDKVERFKYLGSVQQKDRVFEEDMK